ncbi:MAG: SAM-dependent methyltransferase [Actinobacteria bacterium]|nr:SAM-dependent methyltransferase [Actinomycetota bacterium]
MGPTMNELGRAIADHIARNGPIGFDEYVAHALYTPGLGFYAGGGGAGRRRDFLTSPEVGPLFGAVLGRALDAWWDELGRPDRLVLVEAGAGPGTLARTLIASRPRCAEAGALEVVLVEPAEAQWATHPDGVRSRVDLPVPGTFGDAAVVVLANELIDNLPFGLVELTDVGWCEVLVSTEGDRLVEAHRSLEPKRAAWCWGKSGRAAPLGTRIPVLADAASWLAGALDLVAASRGGRVVLFDYTSRSSELARRPWTDWVRTYASHGRAGHPLEDPGSRDITVEVPVDQLASVDEPSSERPQAEFLRAHGVDELVAEGRARWTELGIAGGIEAIAARSRVHEADALLDPTGLGAFGVLEWVRPA